MACYRKKPMEIDAVELGKDSIPESVTILYPHDPPMIWNELHQSWIKLQEGDMIRIDQAPDDVYPIDRETFEQTYEKVD